jgi:AbrB family looped-hinge helix DNA binding protein
MALKNSALPPGLGSKITVKGQVTLPAAIRERLGVKPGDRVVFREKNGDLVVEPADAWVKRTAGMMSHLRAGKGPLSIEEMEEAAAAGWADEPIEPAS